MTRDGCETASGAGSEAASEAASGAASEAASGAASEPESPRAVLAAGRAAWFSSATAVGWASPAWPVDLGGARHLASAFRATLFEPPADAGARSLELLALVVVAAGPSAPDAATVWPPDARWLVEMLTGWPTLDVTLVPVGAAGAAAIDGAAGAAALDGAAGATAPAV